MRRFASPPEAHSGLPDGGEWVPLGLLLVGCLVHFYVSIWFFLTGITPTSEVHLRLSAVLAPLACLVALVWIALRLLRLVPPETATGFSLVAYGLTARALAELYVWLSPPPGRAVLSAEISMSLVDAVRYLGAIAYVTGLAFVVATSARAAGHRLGQAAPPGRRWTVRLGALTCLVAVALLVWLWTPAVMKFHAR